MAGVTLGSVTSYISAYVAGVTLGSVTSYIGAYVAGVTQGSVTSYISACMTSYIASNVRLNAGEQVALCQNNS